MYIEFRLVKWSKQDLGSSWDGWWNQLQCSNQAGVIGNSIVCSVRNYVSNVKAALKVANKYGSSAACPWMLLNWMSELWKIITKQTLPELQVTLHMTNCPIPSIRPNWYPVQYVDRSTRPSGPILTLLLTIYVHTHFNLAKVLIDDKLLPLHKIPHLGWGLALTMVMYYR